MNNILAIAEQCVAENLGGALILGAIVASDIPAKGRANGEVYEEWSVFVAWENEKEFGTHRVQVNTKGESADFVGHYMADKENALKDLLIRAKLITIQHGDD